MKRPNGLLWQKCQWKNLQNDGMQKSFVNVPNGTKRTRHWLYDEKRCMCRKHKFNGYVIPSEENIYVKRN